MIRITISCKNAQYIPISKGVYDKHKPHRGNINIKKVQKYNCNVS